MPGMKSFVPSVLMAALAFAPLADAETGRRALGILNVQALVQPTASFKFEFRDDGLVVTPGDLARGYVELSAASFLSISLLKLRPEITVDFSPVADLFKALEILTEERRTSAAGGSSGGEAVLTYRIYLADGAKPGRYGLPLTFNIAL
jgi:hypothetical protein